jgi:putative Holliday junction resolvase
VLLLVTLGVFLNHFSVSQKENGWLLLFDGREVDAIGMTQEKWGKLTRSCKSVTQVPISSQQHSDIQKLIQAWEITLLVVGLPRHPDGTAHAMTHRCTRFGNQLHGRFQLPVVWIDERYTSATAHDPRGDIDAQAAVMILEQYFASTPSQTMNASVVRGNK